MDRPRGLSGPEFLEIYWIALAVATAFALFVRLRLRARRSRRGRRRSADRGRGAASVPAWHGAGRALAQASAPGVRRPARTRCCSAARPGWSPSADSPPTRISPCAAPCSTSRRSPAGSPRAARTRPATPAVPRDRPAPAALPAAVAAAAVAAREPSPCRWVVRGRRGLIMTVITELGVGIGWRAENDLTVERLPGVDFVEVVAENLHAEHLPESVVLLRERGIPGPAWCPAGARRQLPDRHRSWPRSWRLSGTSGRGIDERRPT
jgi:hypothetical protein